MGAAEPFAHLPFSSLDSPLCPGRFNSGQLIREGTKCRQPSARTQERRSCATPRSSLCLSPCCLPTGCANFDQLTGKDILNGKIDRLSSENAKLQEKVTELEKSLATERTRGKGIKLALFGGDIIYEVDSNAYVDVRAAFRLRAVRDRDFGENFNLYEQGRGGDSQILTLLREIDADKDRFITNAEGIEFRRGEESAFYQRDKTAVSNQAAGR